jgi:hypothetical protein
MKSACSLVLVAGLALAVASARAQSIRTVPTYHNIGVHVQFSTAPPPATAITLAIKDREFYRLL